MTAGKGHSVPPRISRAIKLMPEIAMQMGRSYDILKDEVALRVGKSRCNFAPSNRTCRADMFWNRGTRSSDNAFPGSQTMAAASFGGVYKSVSFLWLKHVVWSEFNTMSGTGTPIFVTVHGAVRSSIKHSLSFWSFLLQNQQAWLELFK